jgi:glycerate-2-kinase
MKETSQEIALRIFQAAVAAALPGPAVRSACRNMRRDIPVDNCRTVRALAFGKAACTMARALTDELGDVIERGLVIAPHGSCEPILSTLVHRGAGHPVPDECGLRATEEALHLVRGLPEDALLLCLISGGGSALLVAPWEGITLAEKKATTNLLLKAGADIGEFNIVRKHVSQVKGGRLAKCAYPARVLSLIVSDVVGDRLDIIASGPTAPDPTTFGDALAVLRKYGLLDKAPTGVRNLLERGARGEVPETPKPGDGIFERVSNVIIAGNKTAIAAAETEALQRGLQPVVLTERLIGEARDAGRWLSRHALAMRRQKRSGSPLCMISGGETTVTVRGKGIGGRNMEMALSFAIQIAGVQGITFLSAGTDGIDGPTDAAGAIVDGATVLRARKRGLSPESCLANNDSYRFFKEDGGLLITGPTGTNVMDVQVAIIE